MESLSKHTKLKVLQCVSAKTWNIHVKKPTTASQRLRLGKTGRRGGVAGEKGLEVRVGGGERAGGEGQQLPCAAE